MKLPATVRFSSTKNCLGGVSAVLGRNLNIDGTNDVKVFRIIQNQCNVYLSLVSFKVKDSGGKAELNLNRFYAAKLGLEEGSNILVEPIDKVSSCTSAWIEPLSVDDWEILELHADEVELQLLDQIRVLWPGQVFPLWVDGSVCIFLKTVKIDPVEECGTLMPLTELFIEPKVNRRTAVPGPDKDRISKPTDQPLQPSTVIPIDTPSVTTQTHSKIYRLYNVLRVKLFCNVYRLLKFLLLFMWKQVPNNFLRLRILLFPSTNKPLMPEIDLSSKAEWLSKNVASVPNDFKLVLRVEPVPFDYSSSANSRPFLSNQPNTIFLLSNQTSKFSSNVYLVLLSKIPSPTEKLDENRLHSKKAGPTKIPVGKDATLDRKDVSGNLNASQQSMEKCVVRMYFHSQSEYAMIPNWNAVCSYNVKVPACVRRQMNLSVSSKVKIQKLLNLPQLCVSITTISFDIIASEPALPSALNFEDIAQSFEEWLGCVSSSEHPIPIARGTLLVFPVTLTSSNDESTFNIETLVAEIKSAQKSSTDDDNTMESTYLLSVDDLSHIETNFSYSSRNETVAFQTDVDIELPVESLLVYGKGLESEVSSLEQFIEIALEARPLVGALLNRKSTLRPTCVLVSGAKGTGKTVLCRSMLRKFGSDSTLNAYVRWVSCGQWRGKKPETVKRHCDNLLYEMLWRQPAVLLLDDLDYLIPSTGNTEDQSPDSVYTLQLVSVIKNFLQSVGGKTLLGWVGTPRVAVLVTTKARTSLHTSMLSSGTHIFNKVIHLELPDLNKREVLLKSLIENFTNFSYPSDMDGVLEKTEGFAAADLLSVVRKSIHLFQQKKLLPVDNKELFFNDDTMEASIFSEALIGFSPASLQNANLHKPSPLTWNDVGGLHSVKQKLIEQLVWPVKYRHVFEECGLQAQSGVLLFGPSGCGKTLLAAVVANECNLNFISIKGPEVLNKYIGASEAAVRDLFSRAKAAAPCVLFFDEFDSLAPKRGHDSTGVTDRVVNQLLTHLDGVEPLVGVTVMAASNRPDLLDPALLRPGRLDSLLYCPLPDVNERHEILRSLSRNLSVKHDVDLMHIAEICENFTGADLKALLYNAQLDAVHETLHSSFSRSASHLEGVKDELPQYSFSTTSPTSDTSSKFLMETDDLYHSNGYGTMEEYDHASATPVSSTYAANLKLTAVELIQSLQRANGDAKLTAGGDVALSERSNSPVNEALVENMIYSDGCSLQPDVDHSQSDGQDISNLSNSIDQSQTLNTELQYNTTPQFFSPSPTIERRHVEQVNNLTSPTTNSGQVFSGEFNFGDEAFVNANDTKSKVVYFAKLHKGRSETIPQDIVELSSKICQNQRYDTKLQDKGTRESLPLNPTIEFSHLSSALNSTRPSISIKERKQLDTLYSSFIRLRERSDSSEKDYYQGMPRTTLS